LGVVGAREQKTCGQRRVHSVDLVEWEACITMSLWPGLSFFFSSARGDGQGEMMRPPIREAEAMDHGDCSLADQSSCALLFPHRNRHCSDRSISCYPFLDGVKNGIVRFDLVVS
jgi:hypothetical protein